MAFTIPEKETLAKLGTAGLEDLRAVALGEATEIRASATRETVTDEQAEQIVVLAAFVEDVDAELAKREKRANAFDTPIPERVVAEPVVIQASAPAKEFEADGTKDVADTTTPPVVAGESTEVVSATVTAAGAVNKNTVRSVGVADVAPYAPAADIPAGEQQDQESKFSVVAAGNLSLGKRGAIGTNAVTDMDTIALAFDEAARSHAGKKVSGRFREQTQIARIVRTAPESQVVMDRDDHTSAFNKLKDLADAWGREQGTQAAIGFCAPSPPDYSTCSPIQIDGILQAPEMVLNRGGLLHNQGLDFADFFNNDLVLPIPGYNILTEAEVESDTAKTCLEIPCPTFVDDRLNIAALCLTGSLLQNRGYPEFVRTFVDGSIAAMTHLVNREILDAISAGSTAVALATVDPWVSDGSVLSQIMSAVEMAIVDLQYAYRTRKGQRFDVIFPYWILAQLRADYLRRNATANDDLADEAINAMFSRRGANVQYVYDWQDAFNPTGTGVVTIPAANQAGHATPILSLPFLTSFLVYLPGTWVIGRQDVIRLDLVYDSTNLAQNQVTQVFIEDGWIPMRMCQFSRVYSINICPNGSTGVQRAVTCTDVTP
jgi:hypothetical protein